MGDPLSVGFTLEEAPSSALDKARAKEIELRVQSTTPVGLMQAIEEICLGRLRGAHEEARLLVDRAGGEASAIVARAREYAEGIEEAAQRQRSEMTATMQSMGNLVALHNQVLEGLMEVHKRLQEPRERTPGNAEAIGKSLEAVIEKLMSFGRWSIEQDPRILAATAARIGGLEALAAPAPQKAKPRPRLGVPGLSNVSMQDVDTMLGELGDDYCQRLKAEAGIGSSSELRIGHIERIYTDWQALKARAATPADSPDHAAQPR